MRSTRSLAKYLVRNMTVWSLAALIMTMTEAAVAQTFGSRPTLFVDDSSYPYSPSDGTITTHWSPGPAGNPVSRYELQDDTARLERALADLAVARQTDPEACLGISGTYHLSRTLHIDGACILGVRVYEDRGFVLKAARRPDGSHGFVPGMLAANAPFKLEGLTLLAEDLAWGIGIHNINGPETTEIRNTKVVGSVGAGVHAVQSSQLVLEDIIVREGQGGFVFYRSTDIMTRYPKVLYHYAGGVDAAGLSSIYKAALSIYGDHPWAAGEITVVYPLLEQNDNHALYVKSRNQPVQVTGGWLEANRGHNVLLEDTHNSQIRYVHINGARFEQFNGFRSRAIVLTGDSADNILEYNYHYGIGGTFIGWHTLPSGVHVATEWARNTIRNWKPGTLSNEVSVLFGNLVGDPPFSSKEVDTLVDPGVPLPTVGDRFSCGDAVTTNSDTPEYEEACDDGNHLADDGCSADCGEVETCGDGKIQNRYGGLLEECDSTDPTQCNPDCTAPSTSTQVSQPVQPTPKALEVDLFSSQFASATSDDQRLADALAAAGANGCVVGEGTLTLTDGNSVAWGGQGRCLKGRGPNRRLVIVADASGGPWTDPYMLTANNGRTQLQHVDFDANGVVDFGLRYHTALNDRMVDVNVSGALRVGLTVEVGNGMVIRDVGSRHNGEAGAWFSDMNGAFVDGLIVEGNGGVGLDVIGYSYTRDDQLDPCQKTLSGGMYLGGLESLDNGGDGLRIRGTASTVLVERAVIARNAGHGVWFDSVRNAVLVDSKFHGPTVAGPGTADARAVFVDGRSYGLVLRNSRVLTAADPAFAAFDFGEYPDRGDPARIGSHGQFVPTVPAGIHSLTPDWNELVDNTDPQDNPIAGTYGVISRQCQPNTTAQEIVIFDTGIDTDGNLGGRAGADAMARSAAAGADLGGIPAIGNYQVMALLSTQNYSLLDAPQRACVPDEVPVVAYDGTVATQLASNWADFTGNYLNLDTDPVIDHSFDQALGGGLSGTRAWTGSKDDATWNWDKDDKRKVDCCNWSSAESTDVGALSEDLSEKNNYWPYAQDAACDQQHRLLGVAWNVD